MKPRLTKCGFGWYCEGNGIKMHASTPKAAYDHWEFAAMRGYGWHHAQRRDWLVRGSTGIGQKEMEEVRTFHNSILGGGRG